MCRKVASQLSVASMWSAASRHPVELPRAIASASVQAAMKPGRSAAIRTASVSPYWRITSRIAVETTGRPPARYSGVLVGLMKRVASLIAKGISATSQPDR